MTGKYIKTDLDIRHYIYSFFTDTSRPPDKIETALHFRTSIEEVELAFHRLAQDHQIVLAPGTSSIWMAHPFSGLPTEHIAEIDSKKFWGN